MGTYIDHIVMDFIKYDNDVVFIRWIPYKAQSVGGFGVYQPLMLGRIVNYIYLKSAFKCATALLQRKTGLKLDADSLYELIELLVEKDIRFKGQLPLIVAIQHISELPQFIGWSTRQSLYMMIVFCQCETGILDNIGLLFRDMGEDEKEILPLEIYCYVKDAKLVEIAALLTVAREGVTSPSLFKELCDEPVLNGSMSLRQLVLSEIVLLMASQLTLVSTSKEVHDELNSKLETLMSMLRLIEVFERVGDKIELYRRYLTKLSKEELAAHMACLLINEGFAKYEDFELKRSISCVTVTRFHQDFLELLESKLSGENEGTRLVIGTTKIYKQHDVDAVWIPRFSNQPTTLEAIPILTNEDDAKGSLPLEASLEKLCYHPFLKDWTPKKSIFKLVCILCLPQLKESLESVRLVACKTEIETIGCELARQGKLIELASLLMVAPEKLIINTSPGSNDLRSNVIRRDIMSGLWASLDAEVRLMGRCNSDKLVEKCKDEQEMKLSALMVLEVFERAGNSINQYLQSDAYNDGMRPRLEIVREIQNLLQKAGFVMNPKDTNLNDTKCFSVTSDPVDSTSLPVPSRPHEFFVAEKKHLLSTQRGLSRTHPVQGSLEGSRPFHTVVQGNSKCSAPWVSTPKSKAFNSGIPSVPWNSRRLFLSLGVNITKMIKRV